MNKGGLFDKVDTTLIYKEPYDEIIATYVNRGWHRYMKMYDILKKYFKGNPTYFDVLRRKYLACIKKRYRVEKERIPGSAEFRFRITEKKVIANVDHKRKPHVKMQRRTMAKI